MTKTTLLSEYPPSSFRDYIMLEGMGCENTLKAYVSDKQWYSHCRRVSSDPMHLNSDNIARFLREQSARGMSKSTVQRNAAVLSSFARYLVYDGVSGKMPILDPLPARDKTLPQVMTEGEIQRIINSCEDGTALGKGTERSSSHTAPDEGVEICS